MICNKIAITPSSRDQITAWALMIGTRREPREEREAIDAIRTREEKSSNANLCPFCASDVSQSMFQQENSSSGMKESG